MEVFQNLKKRNCENKMTALLKWEYVLPKLQLDRDKGPVNHHQYLPKHSKKGIMEIKQKMYASNQNANKRLRRREAIIAQQKACIKSQQQDIKMHEKSCK